MSLLSTFKDGVSGELEVRIRSELQLFDEQLRKTFGCRPFAYTHFYYYQLVLPYKSGNPFLRDVSSKTAIDIIRALTEIAWSKTKRKHPKLTDALIKSSIEKAISYAKSNATNGSLPKSTISKGMLEKLRKMYKPKLNFEFNVHKMVYRYQSLNLVAKDTMQLSLTMKEYSDGYDYECFASPINCHLDKYFSAFPDVDAPFGSLGSFFENYSKIKPGSRCAINPPYQITAMDRTVDILEELIASKHIHGTIVVPAWLDAYYAKKLKKYPSYKVIEKGTMEYEAHSVDSGIRSMKDICPAIVVTF